MVSKPATIPVHACGAYRFNSVLHILQRERPDLFVKGAGGNGAGGEGQPQPPPPPASSSSSAPANANSTGGIGPPHVGLHVIYRLDRLTSGLLILAKSPEEANRMCQELQSGHTKKYYLALVKGDFGRLAFAAPQAPQDVEGEGQGEVLFDAWCHGDEEDGGGQQDGEEGDGAGAQGEEKKKKGAEDATATTAAAPMHWRVQSDGSVDAQAGIRCVSYRDAVYECSPAGKSSRTLFRVLGFDGERSLVACRPITGRTHQVCGCFLAWSGLGCLSR